MIKALWNFICYWYFRYTMVTELYVVEPWEQVFVHCFFLIIFLVVAFFNYSVMLGAISFVLPVNSAALLGTQDFSGALAT